MTHPFRFGVQLSAMPGDQFADRIRTIESLGYSTVFWPDHWGAQYEPIAALAAAAALTTKLKVGSLVFVTAVMDDPAPTRIAGGRAGGGSTARGASVTR